MVVEDMKRLPGFYEIAKLYIKAPMGIILLQLVLAPVQPNFYLSCLPTVSSWCLNISMIQPEKACSWKTAIAIPRLVDAKSCLVVIGKFVLNLPMYYASATIERSLSKCFARMVYILHTNSSASYISIWKSTSHQLFRSFLLLKISLPVTMASQSLSRCSSIWSLFADSLVWVDHQKSKDLVE